ncbi:conserved hypothetical protein [uncultured Paludibacter sp.]|uniref:Gliding motility-associated lipoprotein GldB n=1 Tax=uncultured Paludibacter sp. TaxID=497635 RepID=A0A653A8F7_9BACT|nr:conserved hypothetical protein [uncultured Paludibacter sp.]
MKKIHPAVIFLLIFTLFSCNKSEKRYKPEKSDKNCVEVKINRFDKDLIELDTKNPIQSVKKLYKKYPAFLSLYTYNILEEEDKDTAKIAQLFTQFVADTVFEKVNKKVMETFSGVSDIEKDLSDAFTYIHQYFPDIHIPQIYFFVSGFNRSVLMTDSILGVGTDFYLGADYKPYQDFTYEYLLYNMRRDMVSIDVVSAVLFRYFTFDGKQSRLIDNMLHRGKVIYLLSAFMPEKKMEDILGYSPQQMKWATQYENEIWKAIIGQKDLFSTNVKLISQYLNDAPFTTPISQESPGRLGIYIGWKIVDSYMKNNKNITLQELMKMNDYQKMLENSGYRP